MAMEFSGERVTLDIMRPNHSSYHLYVEHLARYNFCLPYVRNKTVLDAACGVGYGTAHIAQFASKAIGADSDKDAIRSAREEYSSDNIEYVTMDCRQMAFTSTIFDVVVAFEFIEHIHEQEQFLDEVMRVLRPDGILIVSTPNGRAYNALRPNPNPFHRRELSLEDFEHLMRRYFRRVTIYGQRHSRAFLRYREMQTRLDELRLQLSALEGQTRLLMDSLPLVFLRRLIPDHLLRRLPNSVFAKLHRWYHKHPTVYPDREINEHEHSSTVAVSRDTIMTVDDIIISSNLVPESVYLVAMCER